MIIIAEFDETMAEIKPFRAWRYHPSLLKNIGELTSPLFDVASEKQREALYGNALNSIHLTTPRGDQPAKNAAAAFAEWKRKKVIIRDETIIAKFAAHLKDEQIILADGHHRYAGSLAHMKQQMAGNPIHTGNEGYNYHLMWLTNTETNDLRILPTHRLINGIPNFTEPDIMKKFEKRFKIKPVADPGDLHEFILGKRWTFGLVFEENAYAVQLKPEAFPELKWNFPEQVKQLDLTVAHYFIIEEILGIPGKEQTTSDKIEYERNFTKCMTAVMKGKAQMAIITRDVRIDDVKRVCGCGCTMPPKSTFFYPKAVCGFLFCTI